MFSFSCLFASSSSNSPDDRDDRNHDVKSHISVHIDPYPPTNHDLISSLLYTPDPLEGLKTRSAFLSLMSSTTMSSSPSASLSLPKSGMTRNCHSSSSLTTQGPSPDRPFNIHLHQVDDTLKCSYNVSTLARINLLEKVSKQTLALSSESQSKLQSLLLQLQPSRDVQTKFEQLNRRVDHLRHALEMAKRKVDTVKEEKTSNQDTIEARKEEMMERNQLLQRMITSLNRDRSDLDLKKVKLAASRRLLEERRAEVVFTTIYPIEVSPTSSSPIMAVVNNVRTPRSSLPKIAGYSLPDSNPSPKHSSFWGHSSSTSSLTGTTVKERKEDIDDQACIAIGYVAHLLLIISRLTDTPLKYDIEYCGSRSLIIDHLNNDMLNQFYVQSSWRTSDSSEMDERRGRRKQGVKVTLFFKSKGSKDSRMYFKYGLYLVNQVIAQLNWTLDFTVLRNKSLSDASPKSLATNQRLDISNTLINLQYLIQNYIKSYPSDPRNNCLLTGGESKPSPEETYVFREVRAMSEANDLEDRIQNHVGENCLEPSRTEPPATE